MSAGEKQTIGEKENSNDIFFIDAHNSNYQAISKNNGHFETKITYISSGLIVMSLTFVDKNVSCYTKFLFIIGLVFAVLTLMLNLSSYFYGNWKLRKDAEKYLELSKRTDKELTSIKKEARKIGLRTNKDLSRFNFVTLISLFVGIVCLSIFVILNTI